MASLADISILKRLVFESHTMLLAQLREQVANPEANLSRKLVPVEREAKLEKLKRSIPGVIIERQLEPSHELLDLAAQIHESRQLKYLSPEKCTSREWEVSMSKTSKQLSIDSDKLLVKEKRETPDQTTTSDLQILEALKRRGLALAFADIISWEAHERYLQMLFSHLRIEPPASYHKPTIQQVLQADRQVFVTLIREGAKVRRLPDNTLEMDSKIIHALQSYEVGFHLMPLPKPNPAVAKPVKQDQSPAGKAPFTSTSSSSHDRAGPYRPKGKGKSKGKAVLPKALLGRDNTGVDGHGRRLCFNFNLGRCDKVAAGASCDNGYHLCARRGCHAPHAELHHDGGEDGRPKAGKWRLGRIARLAASGADISSAVVIEICSGTARVTACLKHAGCVSSFGVNHVRLPHVCSQVVLADLTTSEGIALLQSWCDNEWVVGLFIDPPCGTALCASPIPKKRKFDQRSSTPQLRSKVHPNGMPNLTWVEKLRVAKSNKLFHLTSQLVKWAIQHGCVVVVKNPHNSLFWQTSFWRDVSSSMFYTTFHNCQYGSPRALKTMLASNAEEFLAINLQCRGPSGTHQHSKEFRGKGFGRSFSSSDYACPFPLARTIAETFIRAFVHRGLKPPPETLREVAPGSLQALRTLRAQAGMQPRASKLCPLLPTYAKTVVLFGPTEKLPGDTVAVRELFVQQCSGTIALPKGSKLLSERAMSSTSSQLNGGDADSSVAPCQDSSDRRLNQVAQTWGVPWSELQFIEVAVNAGHPCKLESLLPDVLKDAIHRTSSSSVAGRAAMRAAKMKWWVLRAQELRAQEQSIKDNMPPEVRRVLEKKNIALWRDMLSSVNYPDMSVVDEFIAGSELVGKAEVTGIWPPKFAPATMTLAELHRNAERERPLLHTRFRADPTDPIVKPVWDQTLEETERGILVGPISLGSIPHHYPLSHRFGVVQGSKTRCVDDFSRSGVNGCAQSFESPKPHSLDVVAGLCKSAMLAAEGSEPWTGRAFDLKSAYRQCAVHPSSEQFAHILVQEPGSGRLWVFRTLALPFGSVKSVHSFMRFAHSIWFLAVAEFDILCANYVDDFVSFCPKNEASSVTNCMHLLFELLGWEFAKTGEKAVPFSERFRALGVSIDLSSWQHGYVLFDNTPGRKQELAESISSHLKSGEISRHEAVRLRGRLQFACGQLFGRVSRSVLAMLTQHAYSNSGPRRMSKDAL